DSLSGRSARLGGLDRSHLRAYERPVEHVEGEAGRPRIVAGDLEIAIQEHVREVGPGMSAEIHHEECDLVDDIHRAHRSIELERVERAEPPVVKHDILEMQVPVDLAYAAGAPPRGECLVERCRGLAREGLEILDVQLDMRRRERLVELGDVLERECARRAALGDRSRKVELGDRLRESLDRYTVQHAFVEQPVDGRMRIELDELHGVFDRGRAADLGRVRGPAYRHDVEIEIRGEAAIQLELRLAETSAAFECRKVEEW